MIIYRLVLLNKLLEDGNTLFKKLKYNKDAHRYSYAIKRVPSMQTIQQKQVFGQLKVHLLLNLCRCTRKQNNLEEAIKLASEVIDMMPSCHEAFHSRAKAHHAAGNLEEAHNDLTEAVRRAPANRELHTILMNLKEELNDLQSTKDPKRTTSNMNQETVDQPPSANSYIKPTIV